MGALPRCRLGSALTLVLVLVTLAIGPSGAVFFLLTDGEEQRCFVVEQPEGTVVNIRYNFPDAGGKQEVLMSSHGSGERQGSDRRHKIKGAGNLMKKIGDKEGKVEFVVPAAGQHEICVKPQTPPQHPWRFSLDLSYGQDDDFYTALAERQRLDEIQLAVVRLNDEVDHLLNEADYMKDREVEFHSHSERMNTAALWWPIMQVCILLVTGVFQVQHLKTFFKTRRLV